MSHDEGLVTRSVEFIWGIIPKAFKLFKTVDIDGETNDRGKLSGNPPAIVVSGDGRRTGVHPRSQNTTRPSNTSSALFRLAGMDDSFLASSMARMKRSRRCGRVYLWMIATTSTGSVLIFGKPSC